MVSNLMIGGVSIGVILIGLFAVDFFLKYSVHNMVARSVGRFTPLKVSGKMLAVVSLIIGIVLLGGISTAWAATGGALFKTASGVDFDDQETMQQDCMIDYARYSSLAAGTAANSDNFTFTSDDSNNENYFIDSYNESTAVGTGEDINGTLTLWLKDSPSTGEECNALIYVVAPSYKDQILTGASADDIYDLVDGSRTTSIIAGLGGANRVDDITWEQNAYLNDGAVATSSSDKERTAVQFTAGEVKNTLGVSFDMDSTAYGKIKKSNQVEFHVKQQVGSQPSDSDPIVYTYTLRKGVLG